MKWGAVAYKYLRESGFWKDIFYEMKQDRLLYITVAFYFFIASLLALLLDTPERLVSTMYIPAWFLGFGLAGMFYFSFYQLPRAIRRNPRSPMTELCRVMMLTRVGLSRLVAGSLLFCSMAVFYGTFTSIKNMLPAITPFHFDAQLAALDAAMHGGSDPWTLLHPVLGRPLVTQVIGAMYGPVWAILLYGSPALFAMHPSLAHLRTRFFVSLFASWIMLGNILAGIGMSAGPAFYGYVTGDHNRFSGLLQYLSSNRALDYHNYLWSAFVAGKVEFASGISAFPSVHLAMSTLLALVSWHINKWMGAILSLYWVIILAGSVHLGWHYAIDGYVSTICVTMIWFAVGWSQRIFGPTRGFRQLQPAVS